MIIDYFAHALSTRKVGTCRVRVHEPYRKCSTRFMLLSVMTPDPNIISTWPPERIDLDLHPQLRASILPTQPPAAVQHVRAGILLLCTHRDVVTRTGRIRPEVNHIGYSLVYSSNMRVAETHEVSRRIILPPITSTTPITPTQDLLSRTKSLSIHPWPTLSRVTLCTRIRMENVYTAHSHIDTSTNASS